VTQPLEDLLLLLNEEQRTQAKRAMAATQIPWRAMRDGNQYLQGASISPRCVGTSRIEGLVRPWNPHAVIAFMKLDAAEECRFTDEDADFIESVQPAATLRTLTTLAQTREAILQAVAELRHLYMNMTSANNATEDTRRLAEGVLAPQIRDLEKLLNT
jgi:hypothetical protein